MKIVNRLGLKWGIALLLVTVLALFNPTKDDFKIYIAGSSNTSISISGGNGEIALFEDAEINPDNDEAGEGSFSIVSGISLTPLIADELVSRRNVFIFSVYEYDSGDRTTTYIGILNHFIELM
jgi:hypothetical protein